jgi:hypothetical protein
MNDDTRDLDENVLMREVSDEALEIAGDPKPEGRSLLFNTSNIADCC